MPAHSLTSTSAPSQQPPPSTGDKAWRGRATRKGTVNVGSDIWGGGKCAEASHERLVARRRAEGGSAHHRQNGLRAVNARTRTTAIANGGLCGSRRGGGGGGGGGGEERRAGRKPPQRAGVFGPGAAGAARGGLGAGKPPHPWTSAPGGAREGSLLLADSEVSPVTHERVKTSRMMSLARTREVPDWAWQRMELDFGSGGTENPGTLGSGSKPYEQTGSS
ncbi:uncharacterized protein LOC128903081 [Rissa tridactyla]|uniref:uncharacterized protein LOC128903081 n=1 Tax=Rissa tridactyla TaxID=75485 RepID=UPI0023BA6E5A|nr:uncharacterized protein LOC128903081 [Rissa tridactyla]